MKKKILFIILLFFILLICSIIGISYFNNQRDNKITLIQDNVILEYGQTYNPMLENLIDLQKFDYIDLKKIEIKSTIVNEKDKEFPAVGTYEILVLYKNITLIQKVNVIDTVSPELFIQDNIQIPNGTDLNTYNFKDLVKISDLSELKDYSIDFTTVNTNVSGEYIAKISIEDIYSNKTEKEFSIIIPEVKKENVIENEQTIQNSDDNSNITTNKDTNNSITKNTNTDISKIKTNKNEESNNTNNEVSQTNISSNLQNNEYTETVTEQQVERCTNNNNHSMSVGNSNKWFNSKEDAILYYETLISYWGKLWENSEIDNDTYNKNCPSGYEVWSCMYCNKWTINFYYR